MKILTTGSLSGLGKYIFEHLGGKAWNRDISDTDKKKIKSEGVDTIIHCAFNSNKTVDSNNLYEYISDNVFLTEELLNIPHKKFVFISSVDVYPKDRSYHKEDDIVDLNNVQGIYGITKLISETFVKKNSPKNLILRCATLLGEYSRKSSTIKIIEDKKPQITLSSKSYFNYILHSDVYDFIKFAIKKNLSGIYNVASSKNISLSKVSELLKKKISFGDYVYNVGKIDNSKISSIFPAFKKTSKEIITEFLKQQLSK